MSSYENPLGVGMDQAALAMSAYIKQQPKYEVMASIFAMFWIFGGLFGDESLYLISMSGSMILFIAVIISSFAPSKKLLLYLHSASFRRLIIAFIAQWMYTGGRSTGKSTMEIAGIEIQINEIADLVILSLFLVWIVTKYGESIDRKGLFSKNTPILLIRGIFKSIILFAAFFAIFTSRRVPENLEIYLILSYLVEPYVYFIFAKLNPSRSSTDMVLGDARLPMVALRESFLSNLMFLLLTMWFGGVTGDEWGIIRVYYLIGFVFTFYMSSEDIKNFKINPLGSGMLGNFLNNVPTELANLNLEEKFGTIIESDITIDLDQELKYSIKSGSIIIPIEEKKNQVTTLVVGKTESFVKSGVQNISEMTDGITTLVIPKKQFSSISNKFSSKQLSTINFKELNLPTIGEISSLINLLSNRMSNWVENLKLELTKFDLSNYGVTESDGVTKVELPGISIIDSPEGTSVKVPFVRVIDTPQANTVRIGSWLTVVEFPKFQMVSLPGIKVLEVPEIGSAVSIFGFKVSDGLPTEYLDQIDSKFSEFLEQWEDRVDSKLGRIVADQNSKMAMNISWDGNFKPLLKSEKQFFGDHLALGPANEASRALLSDYTGNIASTNNEILALTGVTEGDPIYSQDPKSIKSKQKLERKERKALKRKIRAEVKEKVYAELELNHKLDEIDDEITEVKKGMTKKAEDNQFKEIIDVDYEIVDDDVHNENL
ncbi:MAG: hypothetical protein HeimC2_29470 [Candidatus Heimdallarchaeota archaeon LC_2]|nr:MAG: hypothetical protein HeimC2_29470 [Candidatus Heimdallarchaeota archaeon LC_2]